MPSRSSKVYWMNARSTSVETSLVPKMLTVFDAAGFDRLIKPKDLVAIKLHCGEWNNTNYLRPVYARALADRVKALGGRPFVCDTTTLPYSTYPGACHRARLLHDRRAQRLQSGRARLSLRLRRRLHGHR